jgi:hypothetical protein
MYVDVRAFHKPLFDAGLVPEHCRVLDISIGVNGGLMVRYAVFLTPAQLVALGGVFQQVGAEAGREGRVEVEDEDGNA